MVQQKARQTVRIALNSVKTSASEMTSSLVKLEETQNDLGPDGLDIAAIKLTERKAQIKSDGEAALIKNIKMSLWTAMHFTVSVDGLTDSERDAGAYTDVEAEQVILDDTGDHLLTIPDEA